MHLRVPESGSRVLLKAFVSSEAFLLGILHPFSGAHRRRQSVWAHHWGALMSVAAERSHSPSHFSRKRSFEPADSPEHHHPYPSEPHTKRPRQHRRARAGREGLPEVHHASAARASSLLALKGLFPGMEEQVCSRSSLTRSRSLKTGTAEISVQWREVHKAKLL